MRKEMYLSSLALISSWLPFVCSLKIPKSTYDMTGSPRIFSRSSSLNGSSAGQAIVDQIYQEYNLPHNTLGATVFSLLYGVPFEEYSKEFNGPQGLAVLGTNNLYSSHQLSNPSETSVVRPNVDTIYSLAATDLSSSDLVLTVPPMQPDRYYVLAFYDP